MSVNVLLPNENSNSKTNGKKAWLKICEFGNSKRM